jgi:hypothetical protein
LWRRRRRDRVFRPTSYAVMGWGHFPCRRSDHALPSFLFGAESPVCAALAQPPLRRCNYPYWHCSPSAEGSSACRRGTLPPSPDPFSPPPLPSPSLFFPLLSLDFLNRRHRRRTSFDSSWVGFLSSREENVGGSHIARIHHLYPPPYLYLPTYLHILPLFSCCTITPSTSICSSFGFF